jgi:hypothetical protein
MMRMTLELVRPVRTLMMKFDLFADDHMLLNGPCAARALVSVYELLQFVLPLSEKDVEVTNTNRGSFSIVRRVRFVVYLREFRHLLREWR